MDQWYFNEGGKQQGPVSGEEIQSLLTRGSLASATLVWTEGMTEWKPLGEIDRFHASPYAPPTLIETNEVDWSGHESSGPQARPWVRYWARTFDYLTFCTLVGAIGFNVLPQLSKINDTVFGIILLLLYIFIEPIFLCTFGTTPFKALLRVRIRNHDGSKPTYLQGLSRCFSVWIRGQGLGIPIATLVTSIMSYNKLTSEGVTSWDQSGGFSVTHQNIQWWRWLLLAAFAVFSTYLMVKGASA